MIIQEILSDDNWWDEREKDRKHFAELSAAKKKYQQLVDDLSKVEEKTGLYLTDTNVDHENVQDGDNTDQETVEYWNDMYRTACSTAGMAAENAGQNINDLLGRKIY